jgi:hypothetical protein
MLYISLVLSAVLLVAVNLAARRPTRPVTLTAVGGLVLGGGAPFVCLSIFPTVALQALLLCAIGPAWRWSGRGPGRYFGLSVGATLVAYAFVVVESVVPTQKEYVRLRDQYPYESMEGRVPLLPAGRAPAHDPLRVAALEEQIERNAGSAIRAGELKGLHEGAVWLFVNSPGFGVARMSSGPTESGLKYGLRDGPPPPQTGPHAPVPPAGSSAEPEPAPDRGSLDVLHTAGVAEFVHPRGFGFFKDRRHVAGFQGHGFGEVPASPRWEVVRLELVGLLMHEAPVVYVSDRLPRMDYVRGGPTRPLDPFEVEGLAALRQGEDLFARGSRLVGSVRATQQCLGCHGGSRGELLGAFTYTLRPAGR